MKLKLFAALLALCITHMLNAQSFEWARTYGSTNYDDGSAICTDTAGNVYAAGIFQGTVDFDPGPGTFNLTAVGFEDICITKHDENGNFIWAVQFKGDNSNEACNGIVVDDSANVYVTGFFNTPTDFATDTSTNVLTPFGGSDVFLAKLGPNGNLKWVKQIGGANSEVGNAIALAANGDVIITGNFEGIADFNPDSIGISTQISLGYDDIFVAKYSNSGQLIWAKRAGGNNPDYGKDLSLDANGNIYVAGWFIGTVDFDPGVGTANLVSPSGSWDGFVWKLDGTGNYSMAKHLACDIGMGTESITVDGAGNMYASGYFVGTLDLDPGTGTVNVTSTGGDEDIFIVKLDPSGNYAWGKSIGGSVSDRCNDMDANPDGTLAFTGYFNGTVDFDPGPGTQNLVSNGMRDVFIAKMDNGGNLLWAKGFGYLHQDVGSAITIEGSTIYSTGFFAGNNVDLDPDTGIYQVSTPLASADMYIHKLSGCALNLGVTHNNTVLTANAVNVSYQWIDCNTQAILAGATSSSFSPDSNGSYAVIITDGNCSDTSVCITVNSLGTNSEEEFQAAVYPNPANSYLIIQAEEKIESVSVYNALGELVQTETKNAFSVESLPAGIYWLKVKAADNTAILRFIKA